MYIDRSIDFLQDFANDALGRASTLANRIPFSVGSGVGSYNFSFNPGQFTGERPPTFSDLLGVEGDTTQSSLMFLDGEAEKWLDKYFPELNACLKTSPEEWLCGIITGEKPLGLSREAFDAVWHEGRDRAYRTANSEVSQIKAEYVQRGYGLPTGSMVRAITEAGERASDAIATVNRQQTTKDAEIKLDLLKFAEEQAIRLKLGVMSALADFYRQWMMLPDKDIERQKVKAQMYAALQSALSSYYEVELGFERLRLAAAEIKFNSSVSKDKLKIGLADAQPKGDAIARAVSGFADVAAAASNAQSTLAADIITGGGA
jgi:hypothetical protein